MLEFRSSNIGNLGTQSSCHVCNELIGNEIDCMSETANAIYPFSSAYSEELESLDDG
jgi:hypothetical protein